MRILSGILDSACVGIITMIALHSSTRWCWFALCSVAPKMQDGLRHTMNMFDHRRPNPATKRIMSKRKRLEPSLNERLSHDLPKVQSWV